MVGKVLDALSAPAGEEDDRTQAQRYHDALAEAMRRLVASGHAPRAGRRSRSRSGPTSPSPTCSGWTAAPPCRKSGPRRSGPGGPRAAPPRPKPAATAAPGWTGTPPRRSRCDAAMAPIVTGDINIDALDDLVRLCVELDAPPGRQPGTPPRPGPRSSKPSSARPSTCCPAPAAWPASCAAGSSASACPGPSLPLDIGYSETIPAGIRNAVMLRDQHCQWAGRCDQPAGACQVHHTKHKANGGPTSRQGLRASVLVPPSGRDPPLGLDPGPQPRRHHHGLEQEQDQGAAQPRTPGPAGVTPPGSGRERVDPDTV